MGAGSSELKMNGSGPKKSGSRRQWPVKEWDWMGVGESE